MFEEDAEFFPETDNTDDAIDDNEQDYFEVERLN